MTPGRGAPEDRATPVVVVPCFNEARRLDERAFLALAESARVRLLFVDDGSTDATPAVLARLAGAHPGIEVFTLPANAGKAEAVRRGLLVALRGGADTVGYYDADLATPPAELLRLAAELARRPEVSGVFGCRVARLGSTIDRSALRHYLGRAYATLASVALGITVYDTQCGAKLFRVGDTFAAAVARPFRSSWSFDVELLHRLLSGEGTGVALEPDAFVELPLETWHDVHGSKMRAGPALAALLDLFAIGRDRARRRPGSPSRPAVMAPRRRGGPGPAARGRPDDPPGRRRA